MWAPAGATILIVLNLLSMVLAGLRWRHALRTPTPRCEDCPPVSIVQPLCGIETFSAETLATPFGIDWPDYEVIFCVASRADPIIPLVQAALETHPSAQARLLIGNDPISANPKLNNCVKGWRAARHDWIVMADSNVLMPPDYLHRMMVKRDANVGLVVSVPRGTRPSGFFAYAECAMLNTFQARWQYAAAACGEAFAQGKNMLWRRDVLEGAGGIAALGAVSAEDAAATKIMRRLGLQIAVVDYPFAQPLGARSARQVWARHARWARLRRATFPLHYAPEILTGALVPALLAGIAATNFGFSGWLAAALTAIVLYGAEWTLAYVSGMSQGWRTVPAMMLRDVCLPALWIDGWLFDGFSWRGQTMVATTADRPVSSAH